VTPFFAIAALLVLGLLAWLLRPLLAEGRSRALDRSTVNAQLLREQLDELAADQAAGRIDAAQFEQRKLEIESRALEEVAAGTSAAAVTRSPRWVAALLAIVIPLGALPIYLALGEPKALDPQARAPAPQIGPEDVEAMVAQLAERLKSEPDNVEGWTMLARSYYVMKKYPQAAEAYERLLAKSPADATVLTDYADALAMAQGRSLKGKPIELVQRALKIDPNHWKALALAGSDAFERSDYRAALGHWEKLQAALPADSPIAQNIVASIGEARNRLAAAGGSQSPQAAPESAAKSAAKGKPSAAAGAVAGVVQLAAPLAAKVSPDDTVFIFARAAEGPPMPLAALRVKVRELPRRFVLDDAAAMSPQARISAFPRVFVGARISKSGTPMPQSGDLEGRSEIVELGRSDLVVTIDRVVP
jgi:cytochrome c-type biogenesis protein CcmH